MSIGQNHCVNQTNPTTDQQQRSASTKPKQNMPFATLSTCGAIKLKTTESQTTSERQSKRNSHANTRTAPFRWLCLLLMIAQKEINHNIFSLI
uniref:Uncharacterized protein n=1 Tax=Manihot esculenta TaxID=3983 RepID=A0A2C9W2Q1_MANES